MNLATHYLGLELANPLVPSSSPMTLELDLAKRLEDAGAPAIIMHSLFEEALNNDRVSIAHFLHNTSATQQNFIPVGKRCYSNGKQSYLEQLQQLKRHLDIPVIASINGTSLNGWTGHALELEQAGADALELNVYYVAADPYESGHQVENRYLSLVTELCDTLSIPVTVKLSPQCSSLINFVLQLEAAGAAGVSLFNRFYQPDIDIESMRLNPQISLSNTSELLLRLRWISMLRQHSALSIAATGGIHTATDALKALIAGADITHMCSALLRHGPEYLGTVLADMREWLDERGYLTINHLRTSMQHVAATDTVAQERSNYLEVLQSYHPNIENLFRH